MHPDKCLPELVAEKSSLDPSFVHAVRLLAEGKSGILDLLSVHSTLVLLTVVPATEKHPCIAFLGK